MNNPDGIHLMALSGSPFLVAEQPAIPSLKNATVDASDPNDLRLVASDETNVVVYRIQADGSLVQVLRETPFEEGFSITSLSIKETPLAIPMGE